MDWLNDPKRLNSFKKQKHETLGRDDLSLKGSIDRPIISLVTLINSNEHYYTTSTCSGRITVIEKPLGKSGIKKGNLFHISSHEKVVFEDVYNKIKSLVSPKNSAEEDRLSSEESCLWYKFEPFILHIQCFDLVRAKILLDIALNSGCRNSGITLNKQCDKFMVSVRSTSSMEIPIHCSSIDFGIQASYIRFLCDESNRRLDDNFKRLQKLETQVTQELARDLDPPKDDEEKTQ